MCTITATELKENLGKYLVKATKEEILVTKNGKPLIRLVSAKSESLEDFFNDMENLIDPKDVDLEDPKIAGMLGLL